MACQNDLDALLAWAMELQAIAQTGLAYTRDRFDKERFERVREISAEIMSMKTGLPLQHVQNVFCNESGYQTPKIETRSAIFKENKILLVKEGGKWALPGGWIDYNASVAVNAAKEVKEEAGVDAVPERLIAILDRNRHNSPKFAHGILKVFVLCTELGGNFQPNNETTESGYFAMDALPALDDNRTTRAQVRMCFDAACDPNWKVIFD